ncbi:hypothetical protein BGLT_03696 [Caballeronia glathei]|nr:hypothetical protein BGLT_03696 [Caballeronia glathei]
MSKLSNCSGRERHPVRNPKMNAKRTAMRLGYGVSHQCPAIDYGNA